MAGMQNIITALHTKKNLNRTDFCSQNNPTKINSNPTKISTKEKNSSFNFSLEWSRQVDPIIKCTNIFDSQISFDIQAEEEEEVHAIEEAPSFPQTIQ